MSLLWLWHPRELRLLQGGICGRLWQTSFISKERRTIISISVLFLWPSYSFSNQNAEAALLHGADVKDMIEEPMKVGRSFLFCRISSHKKTESWSCLLTIRLLVPVGSSWMLLDLRYIWSSCLSVYLSLGLCVDHQPHFNRKTVAAMY